MQGEEPERFVGDTAGKLLVTMNTEVSEWYTTLTYELCDDEAESKWE